ncbi:MAG TPA: thioesterase [Acidobacteriota bacterium]|nr:thioesterase [Acidobacteriota bacterium]HQF87005.1 thioesterase [Acidobacteriota bacterium]HQG91566.1 thioesterase [Acidobacteriota bacterium]
MAIHWNGTFEVKTYELDHSGRLPLPALLHRMQEAAEHNAVALGFGVEELLRRNLTWMLTKFHLQVDRFLAGRQPLTTETWPSGFEGRYACREFRFYAGEFRELFAVAASRWLMVDIRRGRPVKAQDAFPELFPFDETRVIEDPFPELDPAGPEVHRAEFPVRLADLDINQHVNSLRYIDWIIEAVPDRLWTTHGVGALQVEYRRQSAYGDTVVAATYRAPDADSKSAPVFHHELRNAADDAVLVRARTVRVPFR